MLMGLINWWTFESLSPCSEILGQRLLGWLCWIYGDILRAAGFQGAARFRGNMVFNEKMPLEPGVESISMTPPRYALLLLRLKLKILSDKLAIFTAYDESSFNIIKSVVKLAVQTTYKPCRSRKFIRGQFPMHEIFAILSRPSFTSRTPGPGPEDRTTLLLSSRSSPITWRCPWAPQWTFLCMLSASAQKSNLHRKWHVLVPLDGFPWFNHHSVARVALQYETGTKFSHWVVPELHDIKISEIRYNHVAFFFVFVKSLSRWFYSNCRAGKSSLTHLNFEEGSKANGRVVLRGDESGRLDIEQW